MASAALTEQRKNLPDAPGVYLFRDGKGKVIYVGKAKSIRKRVGGHFSNRVTRGEAEMVELAESIDFIEVGTEAEALLAEQNFIKQYKPRFNIRLRDDKSYPFIAISMDEDFPRVYFTRERHRRDRLYFGPYSSAKRTRSTLDTLGKIFMYRSCQGEIPGRRTGSPCLDYYIKRCGAPCVGYVAQDEYREAIDGVIAFLQGRYREVEQDLEERMKEAAGGPRVRAGGDRAQPAAGGALAARAPARRQRVGRARSTRSASRSAAPTPTRRSSRSATACCRTASRSTSSTRASSTRPRCSRSSSSSTTPTRCRSRRRSSSATTSTPAVGEALGAAARRPRRGAARRARRQAADPRAGERNARLALETERLKEERSRQQRVEALDGLQRALGLDALPIRIECFDISNLMGTHTTASMVVFEGGAPKKSDYRRFNVRGGVEGVPDDFASMAEVLQRRLDNWERQQDLSPHDPKRNESFATLPSLIVIDGGPGQLSAGLRVLQGFRDRGVAVVSLAKRIEEVFLPGRRDPIVLPHDTPALQLLQRVRDEAHRFAITHHRTRRDKAMTESMLDGLPGIGPTRKRALLKHFGSPEAVVGASREELEAVPGVPPKVARELHAHLRMER